MEWKVFTPGQPKWSVHQDTAVIEFGAVFIEQGGHG
jgi:hypothetical protein